MHIVVLGATAPAKSAKGKFRMPKPTGRRKKPTTGATARNVEPLQGRNILLHGLRRTSMRLEPSMWMALEEIAGRESMSLSDLCSRIDGRLAEQARQRGLRPEESDVTLSSGVRVFIFAYYRAAATEEGHLKAGHGMGDPFIKTPFEQKGGEDEGDGGEPPANGDGGVQMKAGETAERRRFLHSLSESGIAEGTLA